MNKSASALILCALAFVAVTVIAYGSIALVFPFVILSLFFFVFLVLALEAYVQLQRTPGIERLPEPNWTSFIYNTWLFRTDVKAWAKYASILALVGSAFLGTMMGAVFLVSIDETGSVTYISWLTGLFLTGTAAAGVATAKHWTEKAQAATE